MYYPQSQIKTNLYTNGTELVYKSNNSKYIGYYWKTADGKFFSGKTPDDKNSQELILLTILSEKTPDQNPQLGYFQVFLEQNSIISSEYTKLNKTFEEPKKIPINYNPQPTEDDYKLGEFTRYFVKKSNENIYIEINKETFNNIQGKNQDYLWQLYFPFKFQWILLGEKNQVYKINQNIVEYISNKLNLFMFPQFLKKDYLKFWKP